MDGFDLDDLGEGKLNLTNDEKDQGEDIFDEKVQKEFADFFQSLGKMDGGGQDMTNISSMLSNMMKEMQGMMPTKQQTGSQGNYEVIANQLLGKLMNKQILEQPMKESVLLYQDIIKNRKAPQADLLRYQKQLKILKQFLSLLESGASQEELIKKFQEMQDHGPPPLGVMLGPMNP